MLMRRWIPVPLALSLVVASPVVAQFHSSREAAAFVDSLRIALHVPGLAVVIVRSDRDRKSVV